MHNKRLLVNIKNELEIEAKNFGREKWLRSRNNGLETTKDGLEITRNG